MALFASWLNRQNLQRSNSQCPPFLHSCASAAAVAGSCATATVGLDAGRLSAARARALKSSSDLRSRSPHFLRHCSLPHRPLGGTLGGGLEQGYPLAEMQHRGRALPRKTPRLSHLVSRAAHALGRGGRRVGLGRRGRGLGRVPVRSSPKISDRIGKVWQPAGLPSVGTTHCVIRRQQRDPCPDHRYRAST